MNKEGGDDLFPLAVSVLVIALGVKLLPLLPFLLLGASIGIGVGAGFLQESKVRSIAVALGAALNAALYGFLLHRLSVLSRPRLLALLGAILVGAVIIAWALRKAAVTTFGRRLGIFFSFPWGTVLTWVALRLAPSGEAASGFLLGRDSLSRPFHLTERNLGYHVQVIAPTGSGKTNLLRNLLENRIRLGHGVVFLDYKGDSELLSWAKATASDYGRGETFREVNLASPEHSIAYNPLSSLEPIELHGQLMNSMTWSEDFYRKMASSALLVVLTGLSARARATGKRFHLGTLHDLLSDKDALADFASELYGMGLPSAEAVSELADQLAKPSAKERLLGLTANLHLIRASSAGRLFAEDSPSPPYSLGEGLDRGDLVFFLINSLKLKESAAVLGRLILQDLMQQIGERYHRGGEHRPVTLVIDEFASFATPDFIEFMDRARGAGVGIVFAHQSRADLDAISPEFKGRIEANANTTILSGVRDPIDAEHFAGMLGTRATNKHTVQTNRLFGFLETETGLRSNREAEEFVVHPNDLKALNQGDVFVIARTVDARHGIVRVPRATDRNPVLSLVPIRRDEAPTPILVTPSSSIASVNSQPSPLD